MRSDAITAQAIKKLLRDLLDLLILFILAHQNAVFLEEHLALPLDDVANLILLVPRQAHLTLVKQRAQELTSLNLLCQLTFADIQELVTTFAFSHHGVMVCILLALLKVLSFLVSRLFLDHSVHGNIHGFGSVADATGRLGD